MANSLLEAFRKYQPRKTAQRQALPPEGDSPDETDILSMVGRTSLSGVNAVGNLLDVPGSMVRDTFGGENPFDQLLPWNAVSDHTRISGRELLRRNGMVGQDDTYGNWWGGFALEQGLDPLNYLSFGAAGAAKTAAGKAAQAAGVFGDVAKASGKGKRLGALTTSLGDLWKGLGKKEAREALTETLVKQGHQVDQYGRPMGDIADQTLGSAAKIGLPFPFNLVSDAGIHIGTGDSAIARGWEGAWDAAGQAASATYPGRFANMLFEPDAMGRFDPHEQDLARQVSAALPSGLAAGRRTAFDAAAGWSDAAKDFAAEYKSTIAAAMPQGHTPADLTAAVSKAFDDSFRLSLERPQEGLVGAVDEVLKHSHGITGSIPSQALQAKIGSLGAGIQDAKRQPFEQFLNMGGSSGLIDSGITGGASDQFQHFYRFTDYAKDANKAKIAGVYQAGRDDAVRHVPAFVADRIAEGAKYKGQYGAQEIANDFGKYLDPGYGGGVAKHAADLADWGADKDIAGFTRGTMPDLSKGLLGIQKARKSLEAIHEFFLDNAVPVAGNAPAGTIPLGQAFKKIGLDDLKAENYFSSLAAARGASSSVAIPKEIVDAAKATLDVVNRPTYQNEVFRLMDGMLGWFKQSVTLPFLRHHTRNLFSGQFMNVASGLLESPDDWRKYGGAMADAWDLLHGNKKNPVVNASREAKIRDVVSEGVYTPKGFEDVGPVTQPRMTPQVPFGGGTWKASGEAVNEANQFLGEVAGGVIPGGIAGRAINRVGAAFDGPRKVYTALLETGSRSGQQIEWLNRAGMYLYLTEHKGWNKTAAAAKVAELQADYTKKTPFERDVMSRLVPFYTWQRRIAPVVMKGIFQRPGGLNAMTIKAANRASGGDATTPDYVRSTASIPLGRDEAGNANYITGFGLPWEQPLEYAANFPSPQAFGREVVSQFNPGIKAPLEWVTGQSFFQRGTAGAGRRLEDMDPVLGRIAANLSGRPDPLSPGAAAEFTFSNSPASVWGTQIRQLTDPRKTIASKLLSLTSGVRVATISPGAQDAVLRERANDLMRDQGGKVWEKMYFPQDALAEMPPEQKQIATRLTQLQTSLAQRAKERKLKKEALPVNQ